MPVLPRHADGAQCQGVWHISWPIREQEYDASAVGHGVRPPARSTDHVRALGEQGVSALDHPTEEETKT